MIKHLSFLAILLLNLVAANALAQKNELQLDLRYWPIDDYETRAGASLSYFRAISASHLLGVKTNFDTDALGLSKTDWRHYALNLDIVNRWVAAGRGGQFYFDLGFSILGKTDRIKPHTYFVDCTVGTPPEQLQLINQLYERGTTGTDFYLGFATAVGLDVRVGPRFLLGINTAFNVYHFGNSISRRFNPGLSLARQF